MTARELLRHCFPWEIRPGVPAPEEAVTGATPRGPAPQGSGEAPAGTPPGGPAPDAAEVRSPAND